jgi:hypothetical protein
MSTAEPGSGPRRGPGIGRELAGLTRISRSHVARRSVASPGQTLGRWPLGIAVGRDLSRHGGTKVAQGPMSE